VGFGNPAGERPLWRYDDRPKLLQPLLHGWHVQGCSGRCWLRESKLNLLVQGALDPDPELAARGVPTSWRYNGNDIDRRAVALMVSFQFGKALSGAARRARHPGFDLARSI
jgi:hypothetical protein